MRPIWWAPLDIVTTRAPGRSSSAGSSSPVSAKWPRWFVPSCISNPSAVVRRGSAITPALLKSRSRSPSHALANSRTDARSARSRRATSMAASGASDPIRAAASSPLPASRTASVTAAPWRASCKAIWSPRPLLAPVTTARRPFRSGMSSAVHGIVADRIEQQLGRETGARFRSRRPLHDREELLDERGIEVRAAAALDLGKRLGDRPRALVGALRDQRVEHVADGCDPPHQRDLLAGEPVRIAAPVPALVVGQRDRLRHLDQRRPRPREYVRADRRVGLHLLPLAGVETAGLLEDAIRDPDLADVVHGARVPKEVGLALVHAHRERQPVTEGAHPRDVLASLVVARLDRGAEPA